MNVVVVSFSSPGTAFQVPLVCVRSFKYFFSEVPFSLSCGALFDGFMPVKFFNYFVHFVSSSLVFFSLLEYFFPKLYWLLLNCFISFISDLVACFLFIVAPKSVSCIPVAHLYISNRRVKTCT